jgi:flagellar protein FlaI
MRRRRRFLQLLSNLGTTDYREFTALVNEYYANPERVMERLEAAEPTGEDVTLGGRSGVDDEGVEVDGGG